MSKATDLLKIPPQDLDAEQSLLGALMISKTAMAQVLGQVKAEHFYREANAHIFRAIMALYERSEPIDLVTISSELKKANRLEDAGGRSYLAEVIDSVPTAANVEKYAQIVEEKYLLRALIDVGSDIVKTAFDEAAEAKDAMEHAQKIIMDISKQTVKDHFVPLKTVLNTVFDTIQSTYTNEDKIIGVTSGYKDLDQMTSGFQHGDLIILAARPSMGKTTLAHLTASASSCAPVIARVWGP